MSNWAKALARVKLSARRAERHRRPSEDLIYSTHTRNTGDPMSTLRTNLTHAMLAALAEMEGNHAKLLVYDRANPADAHTKALAEFYESQRAAAAERYDELQMKVEGIPF